MLFLYTVAIFVNASLLFLVQPMFARMVLPLLGGSPAVWNTALVFFQAALLAGYAYAHASSKWLGVKKQAILHCVLLLIPLFLLPIAVPKDWTPPAETNPIPWLLALLTVSVGLPFFVVSAGSPLLQKWLAATGHKAADDPYFLYAASNLGSMMALLGYPVFVEPALRLADQSRLWAYGFGLLIVLTFAAAFALWRSKTSEIKAPQQSKISGSAPTNQRRWRWVMLAFVPSSLMVSVTTYISTDIAAIPLLWIIPLSLYLLSFIVAFASRPLVPPMAWVRALPIILLPLVITIAARANHPLMILMPLHLLTLFVVAMACHSALAQDRPSTDFLTEFYLWISVGGVLGGAFNALLAPVIFHSVAEYPITLVLACLLGLRAETSLSDASDASQAPESKAHESKERRARICDFVLPLLLGLFTTAMILFLQKQGIESGPLALALVFGIAGLVAFGFSRRPLRFALAVGAILMVGLTFYEDGSSGRVLAAERSFFGVHRVSLDPSGRFHQLVHGDTLHGLQWLDPARRRTPVSYYSLSGPIGDIFKGYSARAQSVGVVGLGAGAIAVYARPEQQWKFFEIDPVVARIAGDLRYFTYLHDCKAPHEVILGDGRLKLNNVADGQFDILILDAYSSDSLPIHLITRQALQLYFRKVSPRGIVIFNISNRNFNIEPVLGNLSRDLGLFGLNRVDGNISETEAKNGKLSSQWVVLARDKALLAPLLADARWKTLKTRDDVGIWTDDYSSLLSVFKW